MDIECQFFKLVFETFDELEDLSAFESAEIGALTTFLAALKLATKETESFVTQYDFRIKLEYDFPYGIGLGSSASFNICLAGAVYSAARKIENGTTRDLSDITFEDRAELWKIKELADQGEGVAHKSVSGTNTTIIALGGLIKYCKLQRF